MTHQHLSLEISILALGQLLLLISQMDSNSSNLSGDLLLPRDNGNQQRERGIFCFFFYPLSLLWLFWCPRMRFKDNQSLHTDCIMNSWVSSLPKPPRTIRKPNLAFLALNTVPLVRCLTPNKYSSNSCWANEYISVLDSWILNLSWELFNHSFIHPFICSKDMY